MILYILRHGEAEPKGKKPDEERALSQKGSERLERTLKLAKSAGVDASRILSSPLLRAKQSAEIASRVFGVSQVIISNSLEPESTPAEVYLELQDAKDNAGIILVSHQPLVSQLLSDLLGSGTNMAMSTGAIARVDVKGHPETGEGTLVFLIPGIP
jgi:phosphohistidine phosphatase